MTRDTTDVREAVHTIKEMSERQKRRADPNFRAAAEQVRDHLFGPFQSAAPFSLIEEPSLLASAAYQDFEVAHRPDGTRPSSLVATPDGYRPLAPTPLRKSGRLAALAETLPTDPDGLLFAKTEYALVPSDVRRTARREWTPSSEAGTRTRTTLADGDTVRVTVKATVRVHVLDRTGGPALTVAQTGQSRNGFTFVYGEGWTADQIGDPLRQATQTALEKTTAHVQNKLPGGAVARLSGAVQSAADVD